MPSGYIYILINPGLSKNLLKIGMTTRTPEERATELSKDTGVPGDFFVAYEESVPDCQYAERIIHKRLSSYRYNQGMEFFKLPLKQAVTVLTEVANQIRVKAAHSKKPDSTAHSPSEYDMSQTDDSIRDMQQHIDNITTPTHYPVDTKRQDVEKRKPELSEGSKKRDIKRPEKTNGNFSYVMGRILIATGLGGGGLLSIYFVPGPAGGLLGFGGLIASVVYLFYLAFVA